MSGVPALEFVSRAIESPCSEAVRGDHCWSYGELAGLANAVARYLKEGGLEQGDRVAMALSNCPEFLALYLGVQLAGGVVVPLNVLDRARTLLRQVEHCGARWLFFDDARDEIGREFDAGQQRPAVAVEANGEKPGSRAGADAGSAEWRRILSSAGTPTTSSEWPIEPVSLALILYTSGTTGRPKGVVLSHRNLHANMRSILGFLPVERDDRCLVLIPFYHSFGNSLITTHLSMGACLVLQNHIAFPRKVLERIETERVTSLYGVPLTFSLLLGKPVPAGIDVSSLKYMAQAGGAMYKPQIRQIRRDVPDIDLYVMYGQTEATARLTYVPPELLESKLGSAGKAVPGVALEVRDLDGNPLPRGSIGEIWVRGDNVMVGYWGDPEGSGTVLHDGWLWTRDRGYLDEDGFLFIEGRSSDLIKTGANRVSPDEIEEVISQLDGVKEVGVTGMQDDVLGQAILAAVVPHAGAYISEKKVKAHCREFLAPYKIPKKVIVRESLPRTHSGKVVRSELTAGNHGVTQND